MHYKMQLLTKKLELTSRAFQCLRNLDFNLTKNASIGLFPIKSEFIKLLLNSCPSKSIKNGDFKKIKIENKNTKKHENKVLFLSSVKCE